MEGAVHSDKIADDQDAALNTEPASDSAKAGKA
jgi:hypothetical protein